jgi:hypothetical protein
MRYIVPANPDTFSIYSLRLRFIVQHLVKPDGIAIYFSPLAIQQIHSSLEETILREEISIERSDDRACFSS